MTDARTEKTLREWLVERKTREEMNPIFDVSRMIGLQGSGENQEYGRAFGVLCLIEDLISEIDRREAVPTVTTAKFKMGDAVRAFGMKDCVIVGAEPYLGYWHLHCSDGVSNIHENWLELIQEDPTNA